jgi:hypothetical protein
MRDTLIDSTNTIIEHNMLYNHPGWVLFLGAVALIIVIGIFVKRREDPAE